MDWKTYSPETWLNVATDGIRFKPDRKTVRAELAAHLEDRTLDIQRIFPDMAEKEAARRALEGMGDPSPLGRDLAKLHRPWLGWLWQASCVALAALTAFFVVYGVSHHEGHKAAGSYIWHKQAEVYGPVKGDKHTLGGYQFQIIGSAFLDYPEGSPYHDVAQVTVRVSSPRFWERVDRWAVSNHLTMVDSTGAQFPMDRAEMNHIKYDRYQTLTGPEESRRGLTYRDISLYLEWERWQPGEHLALEFDFPAGSFTLRADLKERVVME